MLRIGLISGNFSGDFSSMSQKFTIAQMQEFIQFLNPVFHIHRSMRLGLEFGKIKVETNNAVERIQLVSRQREYLAEGIKDLA